MSAKQVSPEQFKQLDFAPGKKEQFLVKVGEFSIGSDICIPVVVARGRGDGPCVLVTAGQHADEAGAIEAVKRFAAEVEPTSIAGTLVMVPLQNAPAWAYRTRHYPLDGPSQGDMASTPGRSDGSMTERVVYAVVECISAKANYNLDIHATHLDSVNYPRATVKSTGQEPPQVQEKRMDLSRKLGYEIVHVSRRWAASAPVAIWNGRGCISTGMEAGEGWRATEPFTSILIRGIRNFCKAVGSMKGNLEMPDVQVEVSRRVEITATRGGMSHLFVKPGQYVRKDDIVAEIRNMFNDVVEELRTPINGIINRCSLLPIVATGNRVCNVAETDIGERWERRTIPELERQISIGGPYRGRDAF